MATRVLSPQKQHEITEYFPPSPQHFPEDLEDDLDLCGVTEIVNENDCKTPPTLTPDSTPTKDTEHKQKSVRSGKSRHHVKELLGDVCDAKSESSSDSETKENKVDRKKNASTKGQNAVKQESVSPADSPRPTQAKVTRNDTGVESAKNKTRRRGGKGRRKPAEPSTATVNPRQNSGSSTTQKKSASAKAAEGSMKVTDFFPVRRSNRRTATDLKKQQRSDLEKKILSKCEDGLKVVDFEGKGRGVVATQEFKRGDFVVEYVGDLIDLSTAKNRETSYSRCSSIGCYMYYFEHNNKHYCLDATAESVYLGRLLNHSCRANVLNCQTKVVAIGDHPYLILVAARDIKVGEELLYDYGDRNKESLAAHPWLAC